MLISDLRFAPLAANSFSKCLQYKQFLLCVVDRIDYFLQCVRERIDSFLQCVVDIIDYFSQCVGDRNDYFTVHC